MNRAFIFRVVSMENATVKAIIVGEQGQCPMCGESGLDYEISEIVDDEVCYPYTCLSCGFSGKEWYSMSFSSHTTEGGNDILA